MTNKEATARRTDMLRMLLHWVLNAAALLIVAHFVNGFVIDGLKSALFAVIVIGC
jgi:putative membrane protein